ncbi:unnamed protein product [Ascophyllum nodosum]
MASSAARKEKKEIDVVGEQRNWDQCVSSELEIAKAWCENWGPLYEGSMTQQQQLEMLQSKLECLPAHKGTQTNYQLSFKGEPPFEEYPIGPMQKNVLRMEDVEQLAKEMMAAQLRK